MKARRQIILIKTKNWRKHMLFSKPYGQLLNNQKKKNFENVVKPIYADTLDF
jgi:hypothetical protein